MKSFYQFEINDWIQLIQLNHNTEPFSIVQLRKKYGNHYRLDQAFLLVKDRWCTPSHCVSTSVIPRLGKYRWHEEHWITEQYYKFSSTKQAFN